MKRVVDVLYGLKGYPNSERFGDFKTDLFANGDTPSIEIDTAGTNGLSITAAMTAAGILISGACTGDGILISGACGDGLHISGSNTVSAVHISGDQATAILVDVDAALTTGLSFAVDAGITMGTGISMVCTGTGTITNAISITYTNSATEVIAVTVATGKTITTGMSLSGAGTYTTGILLDATAIGTGLSITGTCATACIDFGAASVTTGSLIDYVGITGKVSGYLFNGTMTTSTLTDTTIIDDFSCSCASDGLAADTLRGMRRIWSGAMPNGTAVVDFKFMELQWSSAFGSGGADGGTPVILCLDSNATINDSAANFYALDVDLAGLTLTSCANFYGRIITGKTGVDAAINIAGAQTTAINIAAAAGLTTLFTFNAVAGCIIEGDVEPVDDPSNLALGADGVIVINVAGDTCYIPYFSILAS